MIIILTCALAAVSFVISCASPPPPKKEDDKPKGRTRFAASKRSILLGKEPSTDIIPTRRTKPSADFRAVRARSRKAYSNKCSEVFEILAWARVCSEPSHPSSQLPSVTRYVLSSENKHVATIWAYELRERGGFKYWIKTAKGRFLEYDPNSPKAKAARLARNNRAPNIKVGSVIRTDYTHIEFHGEATEFISNAFLAYNWGKKGAAPGNLGEGVQVYQGEELYGTVWIKGHTVYFKAPNGEIFVYQNKEQEEEKDEG